jgi:hypothetical protein
MAIAQRRGLIGFIFLKSQQPLRSMDAAAHFIQLAIKYLLKLEV